MTDPSELRRMEQALDKLQERIATTRGHEREHLRERYRCEHREWIEAGGNEAALKAMREDQDA